MAAEDAAKRLATNKDFLDVMAHLTKEQANMVLSMNPLEAQQLQFALVYYHCLDSILPLVQNLAKDSN